MNASPHGTADIAPISETGLQRLVALGSILGALAASLRE